MIPIQKNAQQGFTLLEVIVALTIVALCFSVLLGVISGGLGQTNRAETLAAAGSLAQSLLADLGTEIPIAPGETDGQFANGFRWRLRIEPYTDPTIPQNLSVGAFRALVQIAWGDDNQERSINLTTLRLGPKQPVR